MKLWGVCVCAHACWSGEEHKKGEDPLLRLHTPLLTFFFWKEIPNSSISVTVNVPVVIIPVACFLSALVSLSLINQKHSLTAAQSASSLKDHPRMPLTFLPSEQKMGVGSLMVISLGDAQFLFCDSLQLWLKSKRMPLWAARGVNSPGSSSSLCEHLQFGYYAFR